MKKTMIIVSVALLAVGLTLFLCAFAAAGFDITKLSTETYITNTYTVADHSRFTRIEIKSSESDITFLPSADGRFSAVCVEREKSPHKVSVDSGTLKITCDDQRQWYDHLTFSAKSLSMTVYLPEKAYEALIIDNGTGDVTIPADFTFGSLDINVSTGDVDCTAAVQGSVKIKASTGDVRFSAEAGGSLKIITSTGDIRLDSVKAESIGLAASTGNISLNGAETIGGITVETSTGNVMMKDAVACGALSADTSTGNVRFENSDAARITVKTTTGDVTGTLRTPKVFYTDTSTGSVRLPDVRMGERCEITTTTGDIIIAVSGQ